jgi:hypothetical protein
MEENSLGLFQNLQIVSAVAAVVLLSYISGIRRKRVVISRGKVREAR